MGMTVVNDLPEEEWRRFVEKHQMGNVFHTPEMFQVFRRTDGYQPELWAVTKHKHVLALLLPVRVTLMNRLLLRHFTTRSIAYGGVLYAHNAEGKEALSFLLKTYTHEVRKKPSSLSYVTCRTWKRFNRFYEAMALPMKTT